MRQFIAILLVCVWATLPAQAEIPFADPSDLRGAEFALERHSRLAFEWREPARPNDEADLEAVSFRRGDGSSEMTAGFGSLDLGVARGAPLLALAAPEAFELPASPHVAASFDLAMNEISTLRWNAFGNSDGSMGVAAAFVAAELELRLAWLKRRDEVGSSGLLGMRWDSRIGGSAFDVAIFEAVEGLTFAARSAWELETGCWRFGLAAEFQQHGGPHPQFTTNASVGFQFARKARVELGWRGGPLAPQGDIFAIRFTLANRFAVRSVQGSR